MFMQFVMVSFIGLVVMFTANCSADESPDTEAVSALNFEVKDIDENDVELSKYKGKVVMIVNVASKCGFVGQYEALQATYDKFKDKGFMILGFPANNFLRQEPGTNEEIKSFCTLNYNVTFDMFAKVSVKGKKIAPIYRFLTSRKTNPDFKGSIKWNFTKFLLNREGKVVARFGTRTKPDSDKVMRAVEAALAEDSEKNES
ncbi:MAG: glutathione peroxidase [Candidatus Hydrogenedentes bacterium]|nr:glutathione peroxidase [Candidatus Hydrogenedentota bacterium]